MRRRTRQSQRWATYVATRRAALDLSQGELGARFGVRGSYISEWERLGIVPSRDVLARGAVALGEDIRPWLVAAGYEEADPPTEAQPAARVSDSLIEYEAVVRVNAETGQILAIEPIPGRPRQGPTRRRRSDTAREDKR